MQQEKNAPIKRSVISFETVLGKVTSVCLIIGGRQLLADGQTILHAFRKNQ